MGRFPGLKIVGNFGVGYDSIDAAAAAKRGIQVLYNAEVIELTIRDGKFAGGRMLHPKPAANSYATVRAGVVLAIRGPEVEMSKRS